MIGLRVIHRAEKARNCDFAFASVGMEQKLIPHKTNVQQAVDAKRDPAKINRAVHNGTNGVNGVSVQKAAARKASSYARETAYITGKKTVS